MTRPSLDDLADRAEALADRFAEYQPADGERDAPMPGILALRLAAWRRDAAERDLADAVHAAREQKVSWRLVGEAIGTTGEAARQRYKSA